MKDEQLIKDLIQEGESEQLEFKENVRKEDIAKILCSFLNKKGGRILIGVNDQGEAIGISDAHKHIKILKEYLYKVIVPEVPINLDVEVIDDKELIHLKVYGGSKQPYIYDGNIYYRNDDKTVKASSSQISELIHGRQKAELSWERQLVLNIDIDALDETLIHSVITESNRNSRSNFKGDDILEFLTYYGLYQNGAFTNACVVLFSKVPAKYIPQIRVRLTEYSEGKTNNNLFRDEIFEGNLFQIQDDLERYINGLGTRSVFAKNQWKRIDFKFPVKALQEGIINALMHRDYSSVSGGIAISVFPDSFVISNSGHFPDGLKIIDLKRNHRSHPVNPDIAHIFFLKGLIDKLGKGTIKLIELCQEQGLKAPVWKDDTDGVTLTFNGPKALSSKKYTNNDGVNDGVNDGINDGVNKIIDDGVNDGVIDGVNDGVIEGIIKLTRIIVQRGRINTNDISVAIGKSKPTVERYLKVAKSAGIIEFKGSPKTGGYEITPKFKKDYYNV